MTLVTATSEIRSFDLLHRRRTLNKLSLRGLSGLFSADASLRRFISTALSVAFGDNLSSWTPADLNIPVTATTQESIRWTTKQLVPSMISDSSTLRDPVKPHSFPINHRDSLSFVHFTWSLSYIISRTTSSNFDVVCLGNKKRVCYETSCSMSEFYISRNQC